MVFSSVIAHWVLSLGEEHFKSCSSESSHVQCRFFWFDSIARSFAQTSKQVISSNW